MKYPKEILNGHLIADGDNGKEAFFLANTNDGYHDLRLTVCTDDCDKLFALWWAKRLTELTKACNGVDNVAEVIAAGKKALGRD